MGSGRSDRLAVFLGDVLAGTRRPCVVTAEQNGSTSTVPTGDDPRSKTHCTYNENGQKTAENGSFDEWPKTLKPLFLPCFLAFGVCIP